LQEDFLNPLPYKFCGFIGYKKTSFLLFIKKNNVLCRCWCSILAKVSASRCWSFLQQHMRQQLANYEIKIYLIDIQHIVPLLVFDFSKSLSQPLLEFVPLLVFDFSKNLSQPLLEFSPTTYASATRQLRNKNLSY
jgi:hypothetical protein